MQTHNDLKKHYSDKALPACAFDPSDYVDELGDLNLSKEQKVDLLHSLWHVVGTFVDIGFGMDSAQYITLDREDNDSRDSKSLVKQFKEKH